MSDENHNYFTSDDDEDLFRIFEALLVLPNNESINHNINIEDETILRDDHEFTLRKVKASSLSLKDLTQELEKRGFQSRGFFDEDARILQACLDQEYDDYIQRQEQDKRTAREREAHDNLLKKRQLLIASERRDEITAISNDIKFASWLNLIFNQNGPANCRIEVNHITVKTLARLLWKQTTDKLISLDLSNMSLTDIDGSFIARSLKNNKTLLRLDISENSIGSMSCEVFADSLSENRVLECLILDSNPLCLPNAFSFRNFTTMLKSNQTLRRLSLFRCQTGIDIGNLFSETLERNHSLISLDVGYNNWNYVDLQCIENSLV